MACSLRPISSCFPKTHPIDLSCTVKYKIKGLLGTGSINTSAFVRYSFTLSNATLQSSSHSPELWLLKHLENRIALSRHLRDELGYVIQPSHKAPNFLLGSGRRQVLYCPYLVWINLNSFLIDHKP